MGVPWKLPPWTARSRATSMSALSLPNQIEAKRHLGDERQHVAARPSLCCRANGFSRPTSFRASCAVTMSPVSVAALDSGRPVDALVEECLQRLQDGPPNSRVAPENSVHRSSEHHRHVRPGPP
ncbi:hypothetical protein Mp_4g22020 [Marchantia polymorpha subsp. ruderalis]|uniref:Uncharacterized protein n=2 Tax=Marchantia polymorpha TaxID=3197 RepID=A0AAF6BCH3_MARPO|nr:hypothetical protein MARPO_2319s0001 [Marchantia polymorpha]BBN09707.1 hypothetical protein Mp_4g22020 [Marchantia polymorpha subsp. ruderalis]|eukprot:PTQ26371.1 hypothetical protein MARPO_2319s0001 [Marchantia polymorpha]